MKKICNSDIFFFCVAEEETLNLKIDWDKESVAEQKFTFSSSYLYILSINYMKV